MNRVRRLLSELVPGQRKKNITTGQAKTILATVKPRDVAGKTRRRLAAEQITDLVSIEKKVKALTRELQEMVLATVKPRDVAGKTRRRLAAEQIAELVAIEKKVKALTRELKEMVLATGSTLMELPGVGPVVAARTLADTGDVTRFADRNKYASWTGTAPI